MSKTRRTGNRNMGGEGGGGRGFVVNWLYSGKKEGEGGGGKKFVVS